MAVLMRLVFSGASGYSRNVAVTMRT